MDVGYDNFLSKFDFQSPGLMVMVTVAIFITLAPAFMDGF